MKSLVKFTGLTATACLLGLTSNLVLAQNAASLSGLLDLVENDRIAESRIRSASAGIPRERE